VPSSAGGTPNQNFVDQVYRDVLHRAPDPGSAGWVTALNTGTSRDDIVDGILNSDEGFRNQVNDFYVRFLGRPADPTGLSGWTNFLRAGNDNIDLAAQLIASQEYFQTQGGGTNLGFLNAVYMDVLCRSISNAEVADRADDFDNGFSDRLDIAAGILDSPEGEDVRDVLSVRSFLRITVPADRAEELVEGDDGDAAFSPGVLSGTAYFNLSQALPPTDFATIPSCDQPPRPADRRLRNAGRHVKYCARRRQVSSRSPAARS